MQLKVHWYISRAVTLSGVTRVPGTESCLEVIDLEHLGHVVAGARRRKKWSQRKLSQVTGLSRSYINDIERGRCTGTARTWAALARALGFSLDDIFLGEWQLRECQRNTR